MGVRLLVVGARAGSLGAAIMGSATEEVGYDYVCSAGISEEDHRLDINNLLDISDTLTEADPDVVVCTVGINEPTKVFDPYLPMKMAEAFRTNVIGPMTLLGEFAGRPREIGRPIRKFIAISSNSARIARTQSMPYCASKAALSMAVRVAAREFARDGVPLNVWAYEPGLLNTAMTREMFAELDEAKPMHRMEGISWEGLNSWALADRIHGDVFLPGDGLNGCVIPFDSGEQ